MDKDITEKTADEAISMLTGYNTRRPYADIWKHLNKEKEREYNKRERALLRLSFSRKIELLEKVNALIEEYTQKKGKKGRE